MDSVYLFFILLWVIILTMCTVAIKGILSDILAELKQSNRTR